MSIQHEHPLARRVRAFGEQLYHFLVQRERRIVWTAAVVFLVLVSALGAWKLWSFAYNGLDLAIYNQVAWNSVHGRWFDFTIHPHSYLGDHLELAFAFIFPLYACLQHPLTLVIVQAAAIAIAVVPLTRLAARFVGKPWHLLFGLAYLANPTVQNMALYEFHLLPFAIPLVSWAILSYVERKFWRFLVFSGLALTVREDVALVIVGFGLLALLDRRRWHWSVVPTVLGAGWFIGAMSLTSALNDYGRYKFLIYYAWLGESLPEMLLNAVRNPLLVLGHLLSFQNLAFATGLLLPFALLPVFRLRWLVPVVPTLLQLMLAVSSSELLIEIHYPALIIPFLLTASAAAFSHIIHPPRSGIFHRLGAERIMVTAIVTAVILYSMVVAGPFVKALPVVAQTPKITERVAIERALSDTVAGKSVAAGFETLTELSSQERLFSLHYVLLGKKQFSDEAYVLPDDVEVILFDYRDALIYQLLYEDQDQNHYGGYGRIRELLDSRGFRPTLALDRFVVYERNPVATIPTVTNDLPARRTGGQSAHAFLRFQGWSTPSGRVESEAVRVGQRAFTTLPFSVSFEKTSDSDEIFQIELQLKKGGRIVHRALLPIGGGTYPTSDWKNNETVTSYFRPLIPAKYADQVLTAELRVLRLSGDVVLNGAKSLALRYRTYETVGPEISLGQISTTR